MIDFAFVLDLAPPRMTAQQKGERAVIGADGRPFVLHFKRAEIVRIEARYLAALRPFAPASPLRGPVAVTFGYYFPATKEAAADMRRHGVAMRRKTSKPDVDNIGKNLLDCMTRAGFFADDSAVALIHAEKFEVTGRPRVSVRVRELAEYPGGLFADAANDAGAGEAVEPAYNARQGACGARGADLPPRSALARL